MSLYQFQLEVRDWMLACFGPEISDNVTERNYRFLEEALELVQSAGLKPDEAHKLVDYVFSRPVGAPPQETGGVMVTLAAWANAMSLSIHKCADDELARCRVNIDKIREKQKGKPMRSPLPQATSTTIRFQLCHPEAQAPTRATDGSAGFDLYSTKSFDLAPGVRHAFPIGVKAAIPPGWCGTIWPRSGWAVNQGLDKLAGLIDSDYRGEIHAVLYNTGDKVIEIRTGDRIAQMVVVPFMGDSEVVDDIDDTDRGSGGFGSTGV